MPRWVCHCVDTWQRAPAINALRGHLTEFGQIVPQGAANAVKLITIEEPTSCQPADAIATLKVLIAALTYLDPGLTPGLAYLDLSRCEGPQKSRKTALSDRKPGVNALLGAK